MSGQKFDDTLHHVFEVFLKIADEELESFLFALGRNPGIFKQFKELGFPSWVNIYDIPREEQFRRMLGDLPIPIDFRSFQSIKDTSKLSEFLDQFKGQERGKEDISEKVNVGPFSFNLIPFVLGVRVFITDLFCRTYFRREIKDLIQEARDGSPKAAINLVSLDSTFIEMECIQKILRNAEFTHDSRIKSDFAKALKKSVIKGRMPKRLRNRYALLLLHSLGFADKPYSAWADILSEYNFEHYSDERNVAKAVKRLGLEKIHPLKKLSQ